MTKKELIKACEAEGEFTNSIASSAISFSALDSQEFDIKLLDKKETEEKLKVVKEPNYSSVKYLNGKFQSKNGNRFNTALEAAMDY